MRSGRTWGRRCYRPCSLSWGWGFRRRDESEARLYQTVDKRLVEGEVLKGQQTIRYEKGFQTFCFADIIWKDGRKANMEEKQRML